MYRIRPAVPKHGRPASTLDLVTDAPAALPCRVHDPELWFAEQPAVLERAKRLCASCPIRTQCLSAAVLRAEPWGVWGGEIVEHGVVVPRKRTRGRPRKDDPLRAAPAAPAA